MNVADDPLSRLASVPGSELARRLRAGLELIDAALRDGYARNDEDPGSDVYPEVRAYLRRVLAESGSAQDARRPRSEGREPEDARPARAGRPGNTAGLPSPPGAPGAGPDSAAGLERSAGPADARAVVSQSAGSGVLSDPPGERLALLSAFTADAEAAGLLGDRRPLAETGRDEAWRRFCLDLLRLPAATARRWRDALAQIEASARPQWTDLPAVREPEILVQPWPEEKVIGLRLVSGVPPDPEVQQILGAAPQAAKIAALSSCMLALAAADGELRDPRKHGMPRLAETQANELYRALLLRRLRDYAVAEAPAERLLRLVDLDEELCSPVHLPIPLRTSWWHAFWTACHGVLWAAKDGVAGADLRALDLPDTSVAGISEYTDRNVRVVGKNGLVLHSLRTYAEIDGQAYPGRVIYGSKA